MFVEAYDWAENLKTASSLDIFWDEIKKLYRELGVDSVFYGLVPSRTDVELYGLTKPAFYLNSHPQEWIESLGEEAFLDNDFAAEMVLQRGQPLIWHLPELWQDATPEQWVQAEFERDIKLTVGVTLPTVGYNSDHVGAVSLNMTEHVDETQFDRYWHSQQQKLITLGYLLDSGVRGQFLPDFLNLTTRQRDILRQLALGRTDSEIAHQLNISVKTVDHHIRRLCARLKVSNRTHAVARGLLLGVVDL